MSLLPASTARRATRRQCLLAAVAGAAALSACTYYVPTPAPGGPASFDRSWYAATGALRDQGLTITIEDRAGGRIVGAAGGGGTVTARLASQADGSVKVQFDSNEVRDAGLMDRVLRSYEARMGR
jgi:hypothetical protein